MNLEELKIALIQDYESDYQVFKKLCAEIGVNSKQLTWYQDAEEIVAVDFDIAYFDLSLSHASYQEAISNLKSRVGDIPIIALIKKIKTGLAIELMKVGASDYLVKWNFEPDQLHKTFLMALAPKDFGRNPSSIQTEFERIFYETPLPQVIYSSGDFQILEANKSAYELYGYTADELRSKTIFDLRPTSEHKRTKEALKGLFEDREHEAKVFKHLTKANDVFYGESSLKVYQSISGNRVIEVIQDVTESKEQEHQLKLMKRVVDSANDPILITEAEPINHPGPKIVYANNSFLKQTGYSIEEVLGQSPRILQGPKTDRKPLDKLKKALAKWEPCQIEVLNYTKSGEGFWVEFSVVPIANEDGWYTHWISIQRETTERIRKEEVRDVFREMNIAVSQSNTLAERYTKVLKIITDYTGFDVAEGWLTNIDNTTLNRAVWITQSSDLEKFMDSDDEMQNITQGYGLPGVVWEKGNVTVWEDLPNHPDFIRKRAAAISGLKTGVSIPLYSEEHLIGAINLFSKQENIRIRPFESLFNKISKHFGAELKRIKTEAELETIFDLTPNLLFVTDKVGIIKKANVQLAKTLGLEVVDCVNLVFKNYILKDHQNTFEKFLEHRILKEDAKEITLPLFVQNGVVWISLTLNYSATEDLVYCIGKDVSEQKSLEDLLSRASEMARIGTYEVNFYNDSVYWSPMTKKIHEVPEDFIPVLSQAINFYREGESRTLVQNYVERAMRGEITGWEFDAELVTAKGNIKWVRALGEVEIIDGEVIRLYGSFQDIDERKRSEKAIIEAKKRYDLAAEAASLGVWDWDVVSDNLVWDHNMRKLYGLEESEFSGAYQAWQDGLHPEDKERGNLAIQNALSGKQDFDLQFRVIYPKTKEVRFIRGQAFVERNEAGEPLRMVGVNYDVTEEEMYKIQLKTANQEREDVLESITDGFFSLNSSWEVTYWNRAAEAILGKKKEETIGRNFWGLYADAKDLSFYKEYHLTMHEGQVRRFVDYYPTLDLWFEVAAYPKHNGIVVYFKDISERINQQKALADLKLLQEHVINSTNDLIWSVDSDLTLILANAAYLKQMDELYGETYRVGEKVKMLLKDSPGFMEEKRDYWVEKYNTVLNGKALHFSLDIPDRSGEEKSFQIGFYPIHSDESKDGSINGVACFARDITERVKYINRIEIQNKQLKSIAWTQSHVVRAPLARIKGLTHLIEQKYYDKEELEQLVSYLQESSKELDDVIKEITDKTDVLNTL